MIFYKSNYAEHYIKSEILIVTIFKLNNDEML